MPKHISYYYYRSTSTILDEYCIQALGVTLPTIALALGFFPQIWEFHKLQSGQVYSSMVAFLDISGCIFGMAAWILQGQDAAGLIPYIVIIFLQLVMLFLKHVWYAVYARGWEGESLPLAAFHHIQLVQYSSYNRGEADGAAVHRAHTSGFCGGF